MGAGEQKEKVVSKATSSFQSSGTGKMPSRDNGKRAKWGGTEEGGKDHEFNFGL